jgi:hypothetical protein
MKSEYSVLITADGPEMHAPLPRVHRQDHKGQEIDSADYFGKELCILFLRDHCPPSEKLLKAIRPAFRRRVEPPECMTVFEGEPARGARICCETECRSVIVDPYGTIRSSLGIMRIPFGILADGQGIVRMKGVVNTADQLEALLARRGRALETLTWERLGPTRHAARTPPAAEIDGVD